MAVAISPYTPELEPAVAAFNARLAGGGVKFQFPRRSADTFVDDDALVRRGFVAVQEGGSVRGGYLLKEQTFRVNDSLLPVGYLHLPLSEGLVNRRYSMLGVQLIAHALKRQPRLFGLGIGSRDEAFARVITALGWSMQPVPFFFRLVRPFRVARGLVALRRTLARRAALEAAAWSGVAALGARYAQRGVPGRAAASAMLDGHWVDQFDDELVDEVWDRHAAQFCFVGCRDAAALRAIYADDARPFLRFQAFAGSTPLGWLVALDTQMAGHPYFGDLRVGTLVDLFGDPAHAGSLIRTAANALAARGVDLIVSNQSAGVWGDALRASGFLGGPSNFFFAASPALLKDLGPLAGCLSSCHLTRGDGDGPINL